jgi:anti-sigma factor RsiW
MNLAQHDIDALVDGELSETRRAELLQQLEQHPAGWRQVALAFLEAQTIGLALKHSPLVEVLPVPLAPRKTMRQPRRLSWQNLGILTACMLFSLLVGYTFARNQLPEVDPIPTSMAVATTQQPANIQPATTIAPIMLAKSLSAEAKLELERQGFLVQEQPRLVHVEIQGRSVPVYYHHVTLRYVGKRTVL